MGGVKFQGDQKKCASSDQIKTNGTRMNAVITSLGGMTVVIKAFLYLSSATVWSRVFHHLIQGYGGDNRV
jgi:hypothetical protein